MSAHKKKKCVVRRCGRLVPREHHSNKCPKHRTRWFRDAHPAAYALAKLRWHAKERGISCTLTLAQFKSFCEETDYLKLKGKSSLSLSVDRKDNLEGYHHWNVQAITIKENCRKQFTDMPAWMREEMRAAERGV